MSRADVVVAPETSPVSPEVLGAGQGRDARGGGAGESGCKEVIWGVHGGSIVDTPIAGWFRENPDLKCRMTGGISILGNHLCGNGFYHCLVICGMVYCCFNHITPTAGWSRMENPIEMDDL